MMLLRLVVRAPLAVPLFSIIMAFVTGGPMAVAFVIVSVLLGFAVFKVSSWSCPSSSASSRSTTA